MSQSSHTRRLSTLITNTINENGELLDQQEVGVDILVKGSEDFFFVFAKHLGTVLQLGGNEIKVLLWCSMNAHLNTNEIVLNKAIKERIARDADISPRSVDNSLTKLCRKEMLKRVDSGVYLVNPDAAWKGKINLKAKRARLFVNYVMEEPQQPLPTDLPGE
ncbi:hypothetical protein SAMN00120144_2511 [Hymenobacter roseosalivarius DSM 11622]|uniref:Plasmid replication protein RepL domain-containing protein n=1 Tax=Hymenobacter roseosalivarius DSM 11622 TaxID=645990 RepID=A0A1W1VF89_9BACT|nr:replication/maintenance protein RepL [Hymenobacter roseosalivarius]SMB92012.1 hypothetical protein SAMN00120144_2511 [Hymenobacter roseosalivarius DSM 11622]